MRPLFIASGPAFKSDYDHDKPFINVDLYPLMLRVLQLFPTKQFPSNGSMDNVWDLLIPPISAEDYDESTQKWFNCELNSIDCLDYLRFLVVFMSFSFVNIFCGSNLETDLFINVLINLFTRFDSLLEYILYFCGLFIFSYSLCFRRFRCLILRKRLSHLQHKYRQIVAKVSTAGYRMGFVGHRTRHRPALTLRPKCQ